jgi:carotenoid 9,10(9',10')-cleavage dioxygenase 1
MVHAVLFRNGRAQSYANHWLRCDRFLDELRAGENIYLRIGDLVGFPGMLILALAQLNPKMFPQPRAHLNYQLGNTSLTMHNGKLLALMEGGRPFQLKVQTSGDRLGEVESVGPYDFEGSMTEATSGHPKICPLTGELHSFFYRCVVSLL